jgi:flagellar L-ring protein precursor FlgH
MPQRARAGATGAVGRAHRAPSLPARVWVLALFAVAPLTPGYRGLRLPLLALASALFAGCAWNEPPTTVHQPMSARAAPLPTRVVNEGAIYQPDTARLVLFEDQRARFVGDTLTIRIEEKTSASKKSSAGANRTSSLNAEVPVWTPSVGASFLQGQQIEASTANNFSGTGNAANNNLFTGNLGVTVIEVLENGNLLVSGEKQVTINRGTEYIRFSGVINPIYISPTNTVSSTRVADARIEYRGTGYVAESQTMGWLSRFFLSVLPF